LLSLKRDVILGVGGGLKRSGKTNGPSAGFVDATC